MEILSQRTPKARKEHKCNYCNGTIEVGEIYHYSAMKTDFFYIWKAHLNCQKLAVELNMFDEVDELLDQDTFQEMVQEHYLDEVDNDTLKLGFEPPSFATQLKWLCDKHLKK